MMLTFFLFIFSECWLFRKKWNIEGVVINNTPPPHKNVRKNFVTTKFVEHFQIKSSHYNGRSRKDELSYANRCFLFQFFLNLDTFLGVQIRIPASETLCVDMPLWMRLRGGGGRDFQSLEKGVGMKKSSKKRECFKRG